MVLNVKASVFNVEAAVLNLEADIVLREAAGVDCEAAVVLFEAAPRARAANADGEAKKAPNRRADKHQKRHVALSDPGSMAA